jgi:hypothetical protein
MNHSGGFLIKLDYLLKNREYISLWELLKPPTYTSYPYVSKTRLESGTKSISPLHWVFHMTPNWELAPYPPNAYIGQNWIPVQYLYWIKTSKLSIYAYNFSI